jgi:hypothetical protein
MDRAGHATAAWMQPQGSMTSYDVATSRFDPASGWSEARPLQTAPGSGSSIRLAADASGDVTAIWLKSTGSGDDLWMARWSAGSWSEPSLLEDQAGGVVEAELAADPRGNVTVVWSQVSGSGVTAWARRYTAGGWGAASVVQSGAYSSSIGVDPSGNAIAVWTRPDGTANLWAARFTPEHGWGAATLIDTDEIGDTFFARVVVSELGTAVVAWDRSDGPDHSGGTLHTWGNAFE